MEGVGTKVESKVMEGPPSRDTPSGEMMRPVWMQARNVAEEMSFTLKNRHCTRRKTKHELLDEDYEDS